MVKMGTKRKVVDNSGVREVRCIRILEGRKRRGRRRKGERRRRRRAVRG